MGLVAQVSTRCSFYHCPSHHTFSCNQGQGSKTHFLNNPTRLFFWVLLGFFYFNVQCEKNLAEKWKLNLLTDWLTSFTIYSRFYFANSLLVDLKALNITKSLVISSTWNETGSNLGWVFAGFLGGCTQKGYLPRFLNPDQGVFDPISMH